MLINWLSVPLPETDQIKNIKGICERVQKLIISLKNSVNESLLRDKFVGKMPNFDGRFQGCIPTLLHRQTGNLARGGSRPLQNFTFSV